MAYCNVYLLCNVINMNVTVPKFYCSAFPNIDWHLQYIPRNMHTVFALLCFVVVIHWLIFPYPSGLLHWHCDNLTIAPVPAKQPWWIWINTSCEFIMNDCITTSKQSTTKPCAYFLGHIVFSKMGGQCISFDDTTIEHAPIERTNPPIQKPPIGCRTRDYSQIYSVALYECFLAGVIFMFHCSYKWPSMVVIGGLAYIWHLVSFENIVPGSPPVRNCICWAAYYETD